MVRPGQRPPFPLVMHVHAVLMGSFLLLLLAQTVMVATGRNALHKQVGIAAFVLVPALVVVGFILAPTMYYQVWGGAHFGPPAGSRERWRRSCRSWRTSCCCRSAPGFCSRCSSRSRSSARASNAGLHKRMMILATAVPLGASIDRMGWLPIEHAGEPVGDRFLYPAGGGADVRVGRGPQPAGARGLQDLAGGLRAGRGGGRLAVGQAVVACDRAAHHGRVTADF